MVQRAQTGEVVTTPGLSLGIGTHNAPPQLPGYGIWLPVMTPESGGLVAFLGVYPSLSLHGFDLPVGRQIPVVLLDIHPVQGLILSLNRQPPLALKCRIPQVSVQPVLPLQDLG